MEFKELLPGVKRNVLLKNYTTFKIGGRARYFFVAKTKKEIISAISVAKKYKLPFFILGGGSNILVADEGFAGLIIKIQNSKATLRGVPPSVRSSKIQNSKIVTEAGTPLSQLVSVAFKNNLTGLEWAIGIPGTVGGAISGNCGAFGKSISDVVKKIEVYKVDELRIMNYELKDCKFGYRDSIFKKNKNLIILSAELKFKKREKTEIQKKMKKYLEHRKKNQPNLPSAGSIFKNPQGSSAGELIEKCNLKGKKVGKAQISKKHANFIFNLGGASAKDVKKLIKLIKQKVKNNFGIKLEEEIQYLK